METRTRTARIATIGLLTLNCMTLVGCDGIAQGAKNWGEGISKAVDDGGNGPNARKNTDPLGDSSKMPQLAGTALNQPVDAGLEPSPDFGGYQGNVSGALINQSATGRPLPRYIQVSGLTSQGYVEKAIPIPAGSSVARIEQMMRGYEQQGYSTQTGNLEYLGGSQPVWSPQPL